MKKIKKISDLQEGLYITITGKPARHYKSWSDGFYISDDGKIIFNNMYRENNRYYSYDEEILGRANVICKIRRKKRIFI